jgi:tetratricopeptide (TPR) repeat protein|tara:strand:+ start:469 stop:870 length:402 start_codon:yes stop_codon:yes gene_type:complete
VIILVGLFSKTPEDIAFKKNIEQFKKFKKLVKKKKYPEALKLGLDYLEKVPYNHDAIFTIGGIYYLKNKYRTAISFFDRALETGDSDVDVLLLKAYSHQKLQENSIAIDCCKKIQDLDPKNKSVFNLISELNS